MLSESPAEGLAGEGRGTYEEKLALVEKLTDEVRLASVSY